MAEGGLCDSSLAIAAFSSWHEDHEAAFEALNEGLNIAAHAALETYSVLTRLPAPHRMDGKLVVEMLDDWFPTAGSRLTLPHSVQSRAVNELADAGVEGGAVYDGLIALTAREASLELVSLDGRAQTTYRRLGVAWRGP